MCLMFKYVTTAHQHWQLHRQYPQTLVWLASILQIPLIELLGALTLQDGRCRVLYFQAHGGPKLNAGDLQNSDPYAMKQRLSQIKG